MKARPANRAFVLQVGWACSYKLLPDGGRQSISFPIAGDIVGLRRVLLRRADHSCSALTDAVVVNPVEGTHIMRCVTELPRLGGDCFARRGHGRRVSMLTSVRSDSAPMS
jgi:hypothetical protein